MLIGIALDMAPVSSHIVAFSDVPDQCAQRGVPRLKPWASWGGERARLAGLLADGHVEVLDHGFVHRPDYRRVGAGGDPGADEDERARRPDVTGRAGLVGAAAELVGG